MIKKKIKLYTINIIKSKIEKNINTFFMYHTVHKKNNVLIYGNKKSSTKLPRRVPILYYYPVMGHLNVLYNFLFTGYMVLTS